MLILLPLLAVLQYRWIGEVSRAERQRVEEHLNQSGFQFASDFNREWGVAVTTFMMQLPPEAPELAEWFVQQREESAAAYPGLVQRVFFAQRNETGVTLQQFNASGQLEKIEWPDNFKTLRQNLAARQGAERGTTPPQPWNPLNSGNPVFPVPSRIPMAPPSWTLVEFSLDTLANQFLPPMVTRHFPPMDTAEYRIAIVTRGPDSRTVYKSDETIADAELTKPDLRLPLFAMEPGRGPNRGGPPQQQGPPQPRPDPGPRGNDQFRGGGFRGQRGERGLRGGPGGLGGPMLGGAWELVVKHRSGSLAVATESLRRRNLGISFGILLLLAASVVMAVISSHRARALAQLQMDFVARVSHELRTPLAIIRSAAYNVATGVVSDEKDVREYAAMVQAEGQRLSTMVDQILTFSRSETGGTTYDLRPLQVQPIIERAIGLHQASSEIDQEIAANLPNVKADERALTDCLQNLLSNATKYGRMGSRSKVKVEARRSDPNTVIISVADSGPGIDSADLPHIFEPFYRGRNARSETPGSGLGLNLVRRLMSAQGGKVTVESEPGQGARFTLYLTAVKEQTT